MSSTVATTRTPAWQSQGVLLRGEGMTGEQALRDAGLDWQVALNPVQTVVPGPDGVTTLGVHGAFATVQMDPHGRPVKGLGVVGTHYRPFQNREVVDLLDGLAGEGAVYDSAGSTHDGRRVFFALDVPEGLRLPADPVGLTILAVTRHDGRGGLGLHVTATRLRCTNQLGHAKRSAVASMTLRHTASMAGKAREVRAALGLVERVREAWTDTADRLLATAFTEAQMRAFTEQLVPDKDADTERQARNAADRRNALQALYRSSPYNEGIHGTAWAAYQAVTEYADWYRPVKGGDGARALGTLYGASDGVKDRALALLTR